MFKKIVRIRSHHLHQQWKFKLLARKFTWGNKATGNRYQHKLFVFKSLLKTPINVLPQTFPLMIWIFTEGEGDGIKSRLSFKIFSTLMPIKIFKCLSLLDFIFTSKPLQVFCLLRKFVSFFFLDYSNEGFVFGLWNLDLLFPLEKKYRI